MISRSISHYKIIEKIGEGGMGEVYLAEDTSLKRKVALKFLSPHLLQNEVARKRFLREAESAAALEHPYICNIKEISRADDGKDFIVMEYVEGETLKEKLKEGPLSFHKSIQISIEVAEALATAHKRGFVHRDLKPANIILSAHGHAKVMDFGLAKRIASEDPIDQAETNTGLTSLGYVVGTWSYISPEQLQGKSADVRSDIFSFGIVLYEMLSGVNPFLKASGLDTANSILNDALPPLSHSRFKIPSLMQHILRKMLDKDPARRYQSIREVLTNLRHHLKGDSDTWNESQKPSIAVLPFVNMSADPEQDYFGDGLAEELINGLTQLEGLRVASRTSAFSFKGSNKSVQKIGNELGVDSILEGSVRKAGDRLRITTQLVNVADGYHIWSERFDRQSDDIFTIQDEISLAIVGKLKLKLFGQETAILTKRHTKSQEAFNNYLKGRYFWNRRYQFGLQKALECFQNAVGDDPNYALPYVGIADTFNILGHFGFIHPKEAYLKARVAAEKAIEIDVTLGEAHASLGWINTYWNWDWETAENEYLFAIKHRPGYATGHEWYAIYLSAMGRFNEARSSIKTALELDPLSLMINAIGGVVHTFAREYDTAIEWFERTVELDPTFSFSYIWWGLTCIQQGNIEEAIALLKKGSTFGGTIAYGLGYLGMAYGMSGNQTEALRIVEQLEELSGKGYVSPHFKALCYAGMREYRKRCFEHFEEAYEHRDSNLVYLYTFPVFDPLREDPSFQNLLRRLNFPE